MSLTVTVDDDLCMAAMRCVELAPDAFALNDDGIPSAARDDCRTTLSLNHVRLSPVISVGRRAALRDHFLEHSALIRRQ
jgi:hypothetical protein